MALDIFLAMPQNRGKSKFLRRESEMKNLKTQSPVRTIRFEPPMPEAAARRVIAQLGGTPPTQSVTHLVTGADPIDVVNPTAVQRHEEFGQVTQGARLGSDEEFSYPDSDPDRERFGGQG
jgi:hypothetical protein